MQLKTLQEREYWLKFAAAALSGMSGNTEQTSVAIAGDAAHMADAMMEQLRIRDKTRLQGDKV